MWAEQTERRIEGVDGLKPEGGWVWPKKDSEAWLGPKLDWENSHKIKWMRHVRGHECVVQAGGCCGMYPFLLSHLFKRVYTFEPDHLNFYCLVQNTQRDNIYKMNVALGDQSRLVALHKSPPVNAG